ncbi:hypothetical protein RclHR1_17790005 [Rhizophagus clarus]|uniref:Uncharacterized protein n=1 Tax=Rhizophagus clarus TaxID=94130 RepID=A0A2Z6RDK5_9GLOM|nr:hypothetical protein RclHR1_17790005 [Rhizophagus clarus]
MEEFLLTREPLDIVRISTALFVATAFEDLCSLTGIKALVIDVETWPDYANANLELLIHDIDQLKSKSVGYEKTMWERIGTELEKVDVESLGFDHPIYSGVLDIKSEPFTKMPGSFCDIFKEPFEKYKLDHNDMILDTCREIIHNEESKINLDEDLSNVEFGKWLNSSERLQEMARRVLESLFKVWKSPKYEAYTKKKKLVNEGSYVCEVLAPLINIVMSELPGNPAVWDIWGEEGSSASTIRKGSRKYAWKPDYMTVVQLEKGAELEIVYLETGRPDSSQDKRQRDHKKLIRFSKDSIDTTRKISKLKRVFNISSKRDIIYIFYKHCGRCYGTLCYAKRIGYLQVLSNRGSTDSATYDFTKCHIPAYPCFDDVKNGCRMYNP